MKKTTKVVLGSVMTMAMCASLIAGSTLALFSSEDSVNLAITSGKVEVEASVAEGSFKTYLANHDGSGYTYKENSGVNGNSGSLGLNGSAYSYTEGNLTLTNIAGGEGISFNLVITNKSTISVKYQVRVTATNDGEKDLASQLRADFQFTKGNESAPTFDLGEMQKDNAGGTPMSATSTFASNWSDPLAAPSSGITEGTTVATVPVGIWLPTTVASDYEEAKCTLKIAVLAYQGNAHVENPPTDGTVAIYNAAELIALSSNREAMSKNVALMDNIYLGGEPVAHRMAKRSAYVVADAVPFAGGTLAFKPIGSAETPFSGTFDGHGYTIYGLNATGTNAGLFGVTENATIKDVKLANATVTAEENGKAGALVAEAKGTLNIENVTVTDSSVTKAEAENATVGALVGSVSEGGTVTVTDVDVQMNESEDTLNPDVGSGSHASALVGSGTIEHTGDSDLEFNPADGYVEKIEIRDGVEKAPYYEISTANGLTYFATTVNDGTTYEKLTVKLVKDIDLKNEPWTPIGTKTAPFNGAFDGAKKTISNLTINDANLDYAGLFGYAPKATIGNLNVTDVNITAHDYAGAVIAYMDNYSASNAVTSLQNITVTNVTVTGRGRIGGLAGELFRCGNCTNLTVRGNVKIEGNYQVGGLAGGIGYCTGNIENLTVDANESGEVIATYLQENFEADKVGGILGWTGSNGNVYKNYSNLTARNLTVKGTRDVGGAIGILHENQPLSNVTLENITVDNRETSEDYAASKTKRLNIGGVVGSAHNNTTITVDGSQLSNVEVYAYYTYSKVSGITVNDGEYVPSQVIGGAYKQGDAVNVQLHLTGKFDGVTVHSSVCVDPVTGALSMMIGDADALRAFAAGVNNGTITTKGLIIKLTDTIDLGNENWTPIGTSSNPFRGTFDGQGHTVTYHIQVDNPEPGYYGLFGYIDNHATIANVTVAGSVTMTGNSVGQRDSSKMIQIGGIVGCIGSEGGTVQNCISLVDFDFSKLITHWYVGGYAMNFGGIVGDAAFATLENLLFAGNVTLNEDMYEEDGKKYPMLMQWSEAASNIGGIAGNVLSSVTISKCLNLGQRYFKGTNGGATAGGIVGHYSSSASFLNKMTECYSYKVCTIGYDAGKTFTGAPGADDAIKEKLTQENWATKCAALRTAGWEWSETYHCPVPAMNA